MRSRATLVIFVSIIALAGAVVWLWQSMMRLDQQLADLNKLASSSLQSQTEQSTFPATSSAEAIANLQTEYSDLASRVSVLETDGLTTADTSSPTNPATPFQTQVIYLGSASTTKKDWTETGIEVVLNSADYPSAVNVFFEAGLSIIGGEAWARLKNKTTGAILSITEVFHNGNITTWKGSPGFKLQTGSSTYVVELKSSSGETANLAGARLRIAK
jgi:hypothetical protein